MVCVMESQQQQQGVGVGAAAQFTCVGCGELIVDQYVLRVSPDMEWHAQCLRCSDCQQLLDETCTCFVRDGNVYCKPDYIRYTHTHTHAHQYLHNTTHTLCASNCQSTTHQGACP